MGMISGEKLGAALTEAMKLKQVGPKEVATHFGVTPPSVKDWQKRGCIHKRHLGRLVAYFADVVPEGHWGAEPEELAAFNKLDGQTRPHHITAFHRTADDSPNLVVSEATARFTLPGRDARTYPLAPTIAWARLGADLYRANDQWPASDLRAVPTTRNVSDAVKWVPVNDDRLSPKVLPGDHVAIDPYGLPKRDEIALFMTPEGEFLLRRWRPLPENSFEAYDEFGLVLDGARHRLRVVGVLVGLYREAV